MGKVLYDQCLFYGYALDELTFFFSPLILWLLIIVSYTIFMIAKCFFRPVVSMGPRRHCFLTRTRDFSFCHGHAQDKTQKSSIITMILFYSTFIISVWRIWYWINQQSPYRCFSLFPLLFGLIL